MKIGDPKKAAVLGAVALIIVGVAIFQIIPKPGNAPAAEVARAQGEVAATTEKKTNESLPTTLTSQPFSKPKIAPPEAPPLPPMPGQQRMAMHDRSTGPLGNVPVTLPGTVTTGLGVSADGTAGVGTSADVAAGGKSPGGKNPGEIAGNNQQLKGAQPKALTFNGVMDINGRTAMITVNDKPDDTRECKIGSIVAGYTIIDITPDTLILHRDKTTLRLTVGSSLSL
jgi:hypothetical protein